MGCAPSSDDNSRKAVPDSGGAPIELDISEFTSIIDAKISGMFNKDMKATEQQNGAFAQHVSEAAGKGKMLVAALVKMEMPAMPGLGDTMKMAVGAETDLQPKTTLHTIFQPAPGTLETTATYAPLICDSSLGFGFNVKVAIQEDGITGTISSYLSQGYNLCGMSLASGQSSTTWMGEGKSASLAELVFQKLVDAPKKEMSAVQVGIKVSVSMGRMKTVVPDFMPYLTQQGGDGWELAGCFMPPQPPPKAGVMSFSFEMPVIIIMQRSEGAVPVKYTMATYEYIMKLGMGGGTITGDVVPMIKSYAQRGWLLKSTLNLPAETSGMTAKLPVRLFFQSGLATE